MLFFSVLLTTEGQWDRRFRRFNYSWKKSCGLEDWNRDIKGFHRFVSCRMSSFSLWWFCVDSNAHFSSSPLLYSPRIATHIPLVRSASLFEIWRDISHTEFSQHLTLFFFLSCDSGEDDSADLKTVFFVLVSNAQPPPSLWWWTWSSTFWSWKAKERKMRWVSRKRCDVDLFKIGLFMNNEKNGLRC